MAGHIHLVPIRRWSPQPLRWTAPGISWQSLSDGDPNTYIQNANANAWIWFELSPALIPTGARIREMWPRYRSYRVSGRQRYWQLSLGIKRPNGAAQLPDRLIHRATSTVSHVWRAGSHYGSWIRRGSSGLLTINQARLQTLLIGARNDRNEPGNTFRISELRCTLWYDERPEVNLTGPGSGDVLLNTNTPTISWTYEDDLEPQEGYQVRIRNLGGQIVYTSTVDSADEFHAVTEPLDPGTYQVSVRARQRWQDINMGRPGGDFWSAWTLWSDGEFTINTIPMAPPMVSSDKELVSAKLRVEPNVNLVPYDLAHMEGLGGNGWDDTDNAITFITDGGAYDGGHALAWEAVTDADSRIGHNPLRIPVAAGTELYVKGMVYRETAVPTPTLFFEDDFDRTVDGGLWNFWWGITNIDLQSVDGDKAVFESSTAELSQTGRLDVPANIDLRFTYGIEGTPVGGNHTMNVRTRLQNASANQGYSWTIAITAAGTVAVAMSSLGGAGALQGSLTVLSGYTAPERLEVRIQEFADIHRMKVWRATDSEPSEWTFEVANGDWQLAGIEGPPGNLRFLVRVDREVDTYLDYVKIDSLAISPTFVAIGANFYDSYGEYLDFSFGSAPAMLPGMWRRIDHRFTVPENAAHLGISFYSFSHDAGEEYLLDSVAVLPDHQDVELIDITRGGVYRPSKNLFPPEDAYIGPDTFWGNVDGDSVIPGFLHDGQYNYGHPAGNVIELASPDSSPYVRNMNRSDGGDPNAFTVTPGETLWVTAMVGVLGNSVNRLAYVRFRWNELDWSWWAETFQVPPGGAPVRMITAPIIVPESANTVSIAFGVTTVGGLEDVPSANDPLPAAETVYFWDLSMIRGIYPRGWEPPQSNVQAVALESTLEYREPGQSEEYRPLELRELVTHQNQPIVAHHEGFDGGWQPNTWGDGWALTAGSPGMLWRANGVGGIDLPDESITVNNRLETTDGMIQKSVFMRFHLAGYLGQGANTRVGVEARASGSGATRNAYRALVSMLPDRVNLLLHRVLDGATVQIGSAHIPGMIPTPSVKYNVELETRGTRIRARVWRDGAEAPDWQIETIDGWLWAGATAAHASVQGVGQPTSNSLQVSDFIVTDLSGVTDVAVPIGGYDYHDYDLAHGVAREYRAKVTATVNDAEISSPYIDALNLINPALDNKVTIDMDRVWIHTIHNPGGTITPFRYIDHGRQDQVEPETHEFRFVGREFPVVEYGEFGERSVSASVSLPDQQSQDELWHLAKHRGLVVYRDQRGRRVKGIMTGVSVEDTPWGRTGSFTVEARGEQP